MKFVAPSLAIVFITLFLWTRSFNSHADPASEVQQYGFKDLDEWGEKDRICQDLLNKKVLNTSLYHGCKTMVDCKKKNAKDFDKKLKYLRSSEEWKENKCEAVAKYRANVIIHHYR
jgi:hypothetical protein